jgi:hypothetical protein
MKILFKYPTRGRLEWFKSTLGKYYFNLSYKYSYDFLITMNLDDAQMNCQSVRDYLNGKYCLRYVYGNFKSKIEAINDGVDSSQFDIMVLVSDDMIPVVKNFDDVIVENFLKYFPDMDGALHFKDDCCGKDKTITLSIMGKKLYHRFGYVYHPAYKSFYCDNEFTDEVYAMGKVVYVPQVIIKHDWKGWGKSDGLYKVNNLLGRNDGRTYKERKALGFPKDVLTKR